MASATNHMIEESILANLKNSFSSAMTRIPLPSLGGTFQFREPSVKEHSSFAKTVISNRDSQSVVYAATLSMMKLLCLDDGFEPLKMSEFDRLRVLVYLFSSNFLSKRLLLKCPRRSCGNAVAYSVKYGTLLSMMDSVDRSDMVFDNKTPLGTLRLTANFPSTMRYLSLLENADGATGGAPLGHEAYAEMDKAFGEASAAAPKLSADEEFAKMIEKRRLVLKGAVKNAVTEKKDFFGNVDAKSGGKQGALLDFADIYMKRIQITGISGIENEFDIDMSSFTYPDTEKILSVLPMSLFTREDGLNVVKFINRSMFSRMNACVPEIKCPKCGYHISERLTLPDFFIFG